MKETGMIFNGDMVRAILAGRKVQTRRLMDTPKKDSRFYCYGYPSDDGKRGPFCAFFKVPGAGGVLNPTPYLQAIKSPYGKIGDRLWVRETWYCPKQHGGFYQREKKIYRADENVLYKKGWKPSIHMPRWAARIILEITDVRVERVQEISQDDAEAEGIHPAAPHRPHPENCGAKAHRGERSIFDCFVCTFKYKWNSIYPGSWDRNDWVWVYGFKKIN